MEFKVEEARKVLLQFTVDKLGEDKVKLIVERIKENAGRGYLGVNIKLRELGLGPAHAILVKHWFKLNGYKVNIADSEIVRAYWD